MPKYQLAVLVRFWYIAEPIFGNRESIKQWLSIHPLVTDSKILPIPEE